MKHTIVKLMLGGSFALSLGAVASDLTAYPGSSNAINAISEPISNAHLEVKILTALGRDPQLHAFDFSVSVDIGTAVLGGTVNDRINKDLAERIAIGMGGIRFVVNHIVVDAGYVRSQHEYDQERE